MAVPMLSHKGAVFTMMCHMHSALTQAARGASKLEGPLIAEAVEQELAAARVIDVHTHLFMPSLEKVGLWGIDHLITYHYLEAELFRFSKITPAEYWTFSTTQKADLIWRTLFLENTPVSEAARGVVAVLHAFGLPLNSPDLITDLNNSRDVVDLSGIDADTTQQYDQAFNLVGSFTGHPGQLMRSYDCGTDTTSFLMDTNGDSVADVIVQASGDHHTFKDFIL